MSDRKKLKIRNEAINSDVIVVTIVLTSATAQQWWGMTQAAKKNMAAGLLHNRQQLYTAALKTRRVRVAASQRRCNYRMLVCTLSATCNSEVQKQNSHWWVRTPCRKSAATFCTVNKPDRVTNRQRQPARQQWKELITHSNSKNWQEREIWLLHLFPPLTS